MSWVYLLAAVALEVSWVVCLKTAQSNGSKAFYALTAIAYVTCLWPLSLATRTIETATAYSIWVGLGIVGVASVSALRSGNPLGWMQLGCIALVLAGSVGLKVLGG